MATQIQLRRDLLANWTLSNPILAKGEVGIETDDMTISSIPYKIGDGVNNWDDLPYQSSDLSDYLSKAIYDPQDISADAFDRANQTGTQTSSTISDFDTEVTNNTEVLANTAKRSYPSADETKLSTIQEGAEVNTINNGDNVSDLVNDADYTNESYVDNLTKITAQLPTVIDVTVGNTIQIYWQAMVSNPDYDNYHFAGLSSTLKTEAKSLPRYFEVTPLSTVDRTLTFYILTNNNEIIDTKTVLLRVSDVIEQPSVHQFAWTVGDSFINNPASTNELVRRLTGTGGTPAGLELQNISFHREGNSGKEWNWYVTNEDSPFVYSGVLDFEQYRIDNNLEIPPVVYISLTWNGVGFNKTDAEWNIWDDDVYTFINNLKSTFPDVEVSIVSPSMPSTNGGESSVNGANGLEGYGDEYQLKVNCLRMAEIYERIKGEVGYEYVRHIQSALQVDSIYNVGSTMTNVNTRNALLQEPIGNNDVHPTDTEGYLQIADAFTYDYINKYCQTQTQFSSISFNRVDDEILTRPTVVYTGNWEFEIDLISNVEDNNQMLLYGLGSQILLYTLGRVGVFGYISPSGIAPATGAYVLKLKRVGADVEIYVDDVLSDTAVGIGADFTLTNVGGSAAQFFNGTINEMTLDGEYCGLNEGEGVKTFGGVGTEFTLNSNGVASDMWV